MAIRTKEYLKARFATGMKPEQADYADLIDSMVQIADIEAVNNPVIDARINAYDTAQKGQTAGSEIATIGDVLYILREFSPLANVKYSLDSVDGVVNWEMIQNKPISSAIQWDEYSFSTDVFASPPGAMQGLSAFKIVEDYAPGPIKAAIAGKKWVILDLSITEIPVVSPALVPTYSVVRLRNVKIGVNPRIVFS